MGEINSVMNDKPIIESPVFSDLYRFNVCRINNKTINYKFPKQTKCHKQTIQYQPRIRGKNH